MNRTTSTDPEPTLHDVIEIMQSGFDRIENRFDGLEGEVRELSRRVGGLGVKVYDMDEHLSAFAQAFDKDTVTLLNHERRIIRLEKVA